MNELNPMSNLAPQRMAPVRAVAERGMEDLVDWCVRNQGLIVQGRSFGFRMALSKEMKDLIALRCPCPDVAERINANLLDI